MINIAMIAMYILILTNVPSTDPTMGSETR